MKVVGILFLLAASSANAQSYSARIGRVSNYQTTVGTTSAAAIPGGSIGGNVVNFKICNNAENTSTHMYVGQASDVATDGVMLGKGQCFECINCKSSILGLMRVKAQAASNGYSVIQFRE